MKCLIAMVTEVCHNQKTRDIGVHIILSPYQMGRGKIVSGANFIGIGVSWPIQYRLVDFNQVCLDITLRVD